MLRVPDRPGDSGAEILVVGRASAARRTDLTVVRPDTGAEELSPLVGILPFQILARHLAIARGTDPDHPRGLTKVTETLCPAAVTAHGQDERDAARRMRCPWR